jgi:hypothetical protein
MTYTMACYADWVRGFIVLRILKRIGSCRIEVAAGLVRVIAMTSKVVVEPILKLTVL